MIFNMFLSVSSFVEDSFDILTEHYLQFSYSFIIFIFW